MTAGRILILGGGSLALEIAAALPAHAPKRSGSPLHVAIASRDPLRAAWIAAQVTARAASLSASVSVASAPLDWGRPERLAALIAGVWPDVILHTASLQSAWSLAGGDRWSALVAQGGYGVTAPLQLVLAQETCRAIALARSHAVLVNACFPDLTNACLRPVPKGGLVGLGNIALVAELLRQHLRADGEGPLRMLAGHFDVGLFAAAPAERRGLPPVWLGPRRVGARSVRGAPRLAQDRSLNAFNAAQSARLVHLLATGGTGLAHVPGPNGLPGGYPVRLGRGRVTLDLPADLAEDDAVKWNRARLAKDGATASPDGTQVRFAPAASAAIRPHLPDYAEGFSTCDASNAAAAFGRLRDRLRSIPCSPQDSPSPYSA